MEPSPNKQHWSLPLLTLIMGIAIGAFIYSRLPEKTPPSRPGVAQTTGVGTAAATEASPDMVQITPEAQTEMGITVAPAAVHSLRDTLSATGTVAEDLVRVAHIRPLARGLIEKAYVRLGDHVAKGDPLVEYDNIDLGIALGEYLSAQAELQRALTDLEVKRTILNRGKEMLKAGAIALTAYDLREAEYRDVEAKTAGARATVSKIEEQIHRFGWSDQDLADMPSKRVSGHSISHTILRAPSSGIITSYHASVGEVVEPATELLAITDMSSLWVLADVFEKDLSHVQTGKSVQVRVTSYPGRVFPARITHVADTIDPKTRTAKVRCVVENTGGLLKLEMFAAIEIPVDHSRSVLAVPDFAIQQIDSKPVVFVRGAASEFRKRAVQTGGSSGGYTEIHSGVKAGDLVVNKGSFVVKTAFLRNLIGENE